MLRSVLEKRWRGLSRNSIGSDLVTVPESRTGESIKSNRDVKPGWGIHIPSDMSKIVRHHNQSIFLAAIIQCLRREDDIGVERFVIGRRHPASASVRPKLGGAANRLGGQREVEMIYRFVEIIEPFQALSLSCAEQFTSNLIVGNLGDDDMCAFQRGVMPPDVELGNHVLRFRGAGRRQRSRIENKDSSHDLTPQSFKCVLIDRLVLAGHEVGIGVCLSLESLPSRSRENPPERQSGPI